MSEIIVINSVTLDGVVQGPGRAEEDTRGGFALGGWAPPAMNDEIQGAVNARVVQAGAAATPRPAKLRNDVGLLGHARPSVRRPPNGAAKYVVSTTLRDPAPWPNTTLIRGDVADAVFALKKRPDNDLVIMGSGELIQTLMRHRLIDEFMLIIHPRILGTGRQLFPDGGTPTSLHLKSAVGTGTGALIATYRQRSV